MAELRKEWDNGGSLTATYTGRGDGSAVFTSDTNEGIEREMSVAFKCGDISIERNVKQDGLRQQYITSDGYIYRVSDGGRYGVLK